MHFPPHSHTYTELVYYENGTVGSVMDGKVHLSQPGVTWLTPPGVTHAEIAHTAYTCVFFALSVKGALPWPIFLEDDVSRSLGRTCAQLVEEWARPSTERNRMLGLLTAQLECQLDRLTRAPSTSRPAQAVAQAERLVEEAAGQLPSVQQLVQRVHVSPSALRAHFQEVRGCSPRQYLQRARLEKAIRFLRTSTLKLETIAELCGYDSASHLSRWIKRSTGQTPGGVRRSGFRMDQRQLGGRIVKSS